MKIAAQYPLHHVTCAPAKFEDFRLRCIYKKIHSLTFDLDLEVNVTQNVAQYPLRHVIYASAMFKVVRSNVRVRRRYNYKKCYGRTDVRTDVRTDRQTIDRLWYEINIPYFSNEKAGIIIIDSVNY